ncbi:MAG: hypothetical protein ACLTM6_11815 [Eggerthella lenta]
MNDREKRILLNNAWCSDCRDANASFAPGYTLHADKFGIVIEAIARNRRAVAGAATRCHPCSGARDDFADAVELNAYHGTNCPRRTTPAPSFCHILS